MNGLKRVFIMCLVFEKAVMGHGQTFDFALTESMRVAQEVTTQLALDEAAATKLLEAALPWDACLAHWNAFRDSVESASIEEAQLLEAMVMVRSNLGACRTERSLAIRVSLDSLQRLEFDKLSLPEKPRVLHFGLHNRMDCVVCKPENNTP